MTPSETMIRKLLNYTGVGINSNDYFHLDSFFVLFCSFQRFSASDITCSFLMLLATALTPMSAFPALPSYLHFKKEEDK